MDFIRFIEVVKSQYKQDLHCSRKKLLHNFAGASCKTLFFQYISYFKTHLHLALQEQYPKVNRPEYKERSKISKLATLSGIPSKWKWMKNYPFLDTSFLFLTKNPNYPDFWSAWSWILVKSVTYRMGFVSHFGVVCTAIRTVAEVNK